LNSSKNFSGFACASEITGASTVVASFASTYACFALSAIADNNLYSVCF
jgi:hypothetical protein